MKSTLAVLTALAGCHAMQAGHAPDAGEIAGDTLPADAGFVPAPHRAIPPATHQSEGGILSPMRVVTIVTQGDPLAAQLFAFGDALITSQWFNAWRNDYAIALPSANLHVTGPAIASGTQLNRAAVAAYIDGAGAPTPDGNTLYMLYLPAGVTLVSGGQVNTNCRVFGGYHQRYHTGGDAFGVAQQCAPKIGETQLDRMTQVGSHEIAEAASDTGAGWGIVAPMRTMPWTASVWSEVEGGGNAEIGDLCAGTRTREGGFQYQRIFSNAAAAANGDPCVPALPDPYFAVTPAQDWISAAPGSTVMIPLTGWSTASVADWALRASIAGSSDATLAFSATITSPTNGTFGTKTLPTINNSGTAMLAITVPAGAVSGSWAAAELGSVHLDANGDAPAAGDFRHMALAGVFVP